MSDLAESCGTDAPGTHLAIDEEPDTTGEVVEQVGLDSVAAQQLVEGARSSEDFTDEYDRAVDFLEAAHVEQALLAMREYKPDTALEQIQEAQHLRAEYVTLLESARGESAHPLQGSFDALREFANAQCSVHAWLRNIAEALRKFRAGEYNQALQILDQPEKAVTVVLGDPTVLSVISATTAGTAETLSAEIRASVQDYAGARAAFDRAASLYRGLIEVILADSPDEAVPEFQVLICEASSKRMQLAQLLQSNDYRSAAEVASRSSEAFTAAADQMLEFDPSSASWLVPLLRSSAEEMLAKMEEARAEVALKQSMWELAEEHSRGAAEHYDGGGRAALSTSFPNARIVQEKLLNAGFNWGVQFRRRLEREQSTQKEREEAQRELKDLYSSIRGALAPAGITVNNQNELVNSVQQQVEIVTRVESHAREVLRELPAALSEVDVPLAEKEQLAAEALEMAGSSESGPGFLDKVKRFAGRLESTVATVGTVAAPVLAILKALAIIP